MKEYKSEKQKSDAALYKIRLINKCTPDPSLKISPHAAKALVALGLMERVYAKPEATHMTTTKGNKLASYYKLLADIPKDDPVSHFYNVGNTTYVMARKNIYVKLADRKDKKVENNSTKPCFFIL